MALRRFAQLALHHRTLTLVAAIAAAACALWLHDGTPGTQAAVQGFVLLVAAPLIGHAHRSHEREQRLARYRTAANIFPLKRTRR